VYSGVDFLGGVVSYQMKARVFVVLVATWKDTRGGLVRYPRE
jgi:hypothetical protein